MKKGMFILIFCLIVFSIYLDIKNKCLVNDNIVLNYNKYLEDELNNLRGFKVDESLDLVLSKVKYRNVYGSNLVIYKGYKDYIEKGDAVLTNDGLVGVIRTTFENESIVDIITDKESVISVKVNDEYGILKKVNNNLVITDINNYSNINIGDSVYTSGLGNINEDIYVGKVNNIKLNNTGIEKIIYVDIGNRLNNINYVYVWRRK